jgi:hypothetical protein
MGQGHGNIGKKKQRDFGNDAKKQHGNSGFLTGFDRFWAENDSF